MVQATKFTSANTVVRVTGGSGIFPLLVLSSMKNNSQLTRIVLYQNLGFLSIMAICCFGDLRMLASLLFSHRPLALVYQSSTFDIILVLAVWLLVTTSTRRVLERIRYLEKFMRVCAWCRRIRHHGDWMQLEQFMQTGFDTPTTHGICPECSEREQERVRLARLARLKQAKEQISTN